MKKNNNKHLDNINIIREFVDIVNKDDLSKLEYESEDFKINGDHVISSSYFSVNLPW